MVQVTGRRSGRVLVSRRYQKYFICLVLVFFTVGMIQGIALVMDTDLLTMFRSSDLQKTHLDRDSVQIPIIKHGFGHLEKDSDSNSNHFIPKIGKTTFSHADVEEKGGFEFRLKKMETENNWPKPDYNVHVFYYPWYGQPEFDGRYLHWNHKFLPHWDKDEAVKWPQGQHVPPEDIGANFYPELGPYSSQDPKVLENHMQQIRSAGIGVLSVSWAPPSEEDMFDRVLPQILKMAHRYRLKVCLHIEPYKGRNHMTFRNNLVYILEKYGNHPAFYRRLHKTRHLPLYYVYDSYLTGWDDWGRLFRKDGSMTVRNTDLDAIFIGLVAHENHRVELMSAGFDGFYTYFASNGFTYGSSIKNWQDIANYANEYDGFFIPSIGPGYVDTRVRPWNRKNTRQRQGGQYYEMIFRAALDVKPFILSITSFNEWHEGTQIEKAVPHQYGAFKYLDYSPQSPDHYLKLTEKWIQEFQKLSRG